MPPSAPPPRSGACPFPVSQGPTLNPAFATLRQGPLPRVRLPHGGDAWLVTGYDDVRTVLSDARFSISAPQDGEQPRMRSGARAVSGLFALDPPEHSRLRSVVGRNFTPRRVELLRPRIAELTAACLERMEAAGPPADLVASLATPVPTGVVCTMMGVPEEDHGLFEGWARLILSHDARPEELARRFEDFSAYLREMVARRRKEPTDDIIGTMVLACDEERRISEPELYAVAADLLSAGFVSTSDALTALVHGLLSGPRRYTRLVERPELIPGAVEEIVRHMPLLSSFTFPRYATEDVDLGGVRVRAGEPVVPVVTAANHDPAVFENPDVIDLERVGPPHLSFGHGPHYCIGAQLARFELRLMLEALVRRFPRLALAVPQDRLVWRSGHLLNGLEELPVTW
ncbi:cytochrome P450 [Streptomyces avicenniae]|uniref:cytochrome P450 n=1 Tax=Streptomyces avicenniae TaxID=500153 RepID=UPI00069BF46E|nr:cytochrome P450 [Streptomyces avicenniae]